MRKADSKVCVNRHGKSGAVRTACQARSAVYIRVADKLRGECCNLCSRSGAGGRCRRLSLRCFRLSRLRRSGIRGCCCLSCCCRSVCHCRCCGICRGRCCLNCRDALRGAACRKVCIVRFDRRICLRDRICFIRRRHRRFLCCQVCLIQGVNIARRDRCGLLRGVGSFIYRRSRCCRRFLLREVSRILGFLLCNVSRIFRFLLRDIGCVFRFFSLGLFLNRLTGRINRFRTDERRGNISVYTVAGHDLNPVAKVFHDLKVCVLADHVDDLGILRCVRSYIQRLCSDHRVGVSGILCDLLRFLAGRDQVSGHIAFHITGTDFVPAVFVYIFNVNRVVRPEGSYNLTLGIAGRTDIDVILCLRETGRIYHASVNRRLRLGLRLRSLRLRFGLGGLRLRFGLCGLRLRFGLCRCLLFRLSFFRRGFRLRLLLRFLNCLVRTEACQRQGSSIRSPDQAHRQAHRQGCCCVTFPSLSHCQYLRIAPVCCENVINVTEILHFNCRHDTKRGEACQHIL